MYNQHITRLVEQVLMLGLGGYGFYISKQPKFFSKETRPEVVQKRIKTLQICGVVALLMGMGQLAFFDWRAFHAEYVVHNLDKRVTAIAQSAANIPARNERNTVMLQQFKAIDLDNTPPEVKQAFNDWVDAQTRLYDAVKSLQDASVFTQTLKERASALKDALDKYQ